ncbi:hypothetical protein CRENBAI_025471 [Crenichthys baileyi]|uniref:Uncharacterized protein n=1 Tax=Crenichthys baileyi TaxID=28760 RepID=A0AAV9SPK5_9TELE
MDQARRLQEFKIGEIIAKLFSHLQTSPRSLHGGDLEPANRLKDWLEEWGSFFPQDTLTQYTIESERQKALTEIATSMQRLPPPSSTPLSTEHPSAPGFTPDLPSSPLPAPDPVPGPDLEENPFHSQIPILFRRSPLMCRLYILLLFMRGSRMDSLHFLFPFLVLFWRELEDELSPPPVPVREGCEDAVPPSGDPQQLILSRAPPPASSWPTS